MSDADIAVAASCRESATSSCNPDKVHKWQGVRNPWAALAGVDSSSSDSESAEDTSESETVLRTRVDACGVEVLGVGGDLRRVQLRLRDVAGRTAALELRRGLSGLQQHVSATTERGRERASASSHAVGRTLTKPQKPLASRNRLWTALVYPPGSPCKLPNALRAEAPRRLGIVCERTEGCV
jgi:hypothetical protein